MGSIRLLLALSVVIYHIGGQKFVGGFVAVQAFFIISGFYMAMILDSGYYDIKLFYSNRALRLFPLYFVILFFAVLFLSISGRTYLGVTPDAFSDVSLSGRMLLLFLNIFMFGQDWIFFLGDTGDSLEFTANVWTTKPLLLKFALIPQAWSLGTELVFYLFAPFLSRLSIRQLALIFLVSGIGRILMYSAGYNFDPWTYRFFPFEVGLFVMGMIAYKLSARIPHNSRIFSARVGGVLLALILFQTVIYKDVIQDDSYIRWLYLIQIGAYMPAIFSLTRKNRWDRLIGDLSYPLYISHVLVIDVSKYYLKGNGINLKADPYMWGFIILALCLLFALVLYTLVDRPVEKIRQKRKSAQMRRQPLAACIVESSGQAERAAAQDDKSGG